eukprot:TRINITY_DN2209_c1_g1_i2.p2 TRINITY_DN2209_c1_g1~~TRINITY_DN2209_c1_g1_i2.p2  ORF type:complete len:105 (+),score=12.14 TRINITY_DN2209_c1_g1_i2:410-724(+)
MYHHHAIHSGSPIHVFNVTALRSHSSNAMSNFPPSRSFESLNPFHSAFSHSEWNVSRQGKQPKWTHNKFQTRCQAMWILKLQFQDTQTHRFHSTMYSGRFKTFG